MMKPPCYSLFNTLEVDVGLTGVFCPKSRQSRMRYQCDFGDGEEDDRKSCSDENLEAKIIYKIIRGIRHQLHLVLAACQMSIRWEVDQSNERNQSETEFIAESLTGFSNPVLAAQDLLTRGLFTKWVIIKMGSRGSLMMTSKGLYCAPAFKVDVADTVGCGDSFAAAIVLGYINCMPVITTLALANAVGSATAMGCGAGRNVATVEKVCEILRASELRNGYEEYWKELLQQGNLTKSEIAVLVKKVINGQSKSVRHVEVQNVARDALHLVQKCIHEKRYFTKVHVKESK